MQTSMYDRLAATAESYIHSMRPQTPGEVDFNPEAILSHLTPSFRFGFGHKFFMSTVPPFQGEKTGQGFVEQMAAIAPSLRTWRIDITSLCVDTRVRSVVVRADFYMVPKEGEEVLNDLIMWCFMDESGEKLVRCTEFVDPMATSELAARRQKSVG